MGQLLLLCAHHCHHKFRQNCRQPARLEQKLLIHWSCDSYHQASCHFHNMYAAAIAALCWQQQLCHRDGWQVGFTQDSAHTMLCCCYSH
jgi:hypothetical protein